MSLRYPQFDPSKAERSAARQFFASLKDTLPCVSCRQHYGKYFDDTFTSNTLDTRVALARWVYDLHEAVNKRLGKPVGQVKFEDLPQLYNAFPLRYVSLDGQNLLTTPRFTTLDNDFAGCDAKIELSDALKRALREDDTSLDIDAQKAAAAVTQERIAKEKRQKTVEIVVYVGCSLLLVLLVASIIVVNAKHVQQRQPGRRAPKTTQMTVPDEIDSSADLSLAR